MSDTKRQFFGTDGIRGRANHYPLTPDFIVRLGQVVAELLLRRNECSLNCPSVVIGKDTRQSGDMLEQAIAAGFNSRGVNTYFAGVVPTPAVAMLTRQCGAILGVVISASHNPFEDNGIKFFGPDGFKFDDALEVEIERSILSDPDAYSGAIGRGYPLQNAAEDYVSFVREGVGNDETLLEGLTIALDAANGASHITSAAAFRSLGAKVISFHDQPNGTNINAHCGCTHTDVIEGLVEETGAHIGVSHDGDADRALFCDENGSALDGDEILAIAAVHMIGEGSLKDNTLVATVMSNAGLEEAVSQVGGQVVRAGVGDRYVLQKMKERGYNLGGEQSGHFIFLDHNTTGDGLVSALQLLRIMKETEKPLSELRKVLTKSPQIQRNLRVKKKPELQEMKAAAKVAEIERELGDGGRVLIRYSGTEPLLRILVEGRDNEQIKRKINELAAAIEEEIGV